MKAMKTPAEQENFRAAHIKDGVAVCRFICWLQSHVGKEPITECSAAAKLESFRLSSRTIWGQALTPSWPSVPTEPSSTMNPRRRRMCRWSPAASAWRIPADTIFRGPRTSPVPIAGAG